MGNKDSKPTTSLADWEKIDTDNGIDIYRNKKTNELSEKRAVTIDPHYDLNDQLKIYHMREHNRDALVRALATQNIDKKSSSQGICSGHKKIFVLTEKMPYRLSELPQLTFPESLLFLREALRAYSKVFKSYGPIHVTKQVIGINDFGQVKCWVNQNWALNHPDHDFPSLQSTKLQDLTKQQFLAYGAKYRDETEMVHNITAVIQQKCQQGQFPKAFSEQVQLHSGSFKKLSLYLEDFINYNQIFIPPKINYETVFVSKYETRLAQQHQQSAQQNNQSNQNNVMRNQNQQVTNQQQINQSVQNGQSVSNQQYQNYGYGYSNQQGQTSVPLAQQNRIGYSNQNQTVSNQQYQSGTQGPVVGGYTVSKTTTTYGGVGGLSGNSGVGNIGNTTVAGQSSLYGGNADKNLWTNTQSVYKPTDQNKYSSSYSQYTTSNKDTTPTYNFGGIIGGTQTSTKFETYKPATYTNNSLGSSVSYNYSSSNNFSNANNNYTGIGNNYGNTSNLTYNTGGTLSDNLVSPYSKSSNYQQRVVTQNISVNPSKNPQNYQEFKKIFDQGILIDGLTGQKIGNSSNFAIGTSSNYATTNISPTYSSSSYNVSPAINGVSNFNSSGYSSNSTGGYNPNSATKYQTYTTTYNTGYAEPTYGYSAEKGSNYSFDGKHDFNSKLAGGYSGSGYSNTLAKYQTSSHQNPDTALRIQGKYSDAFNSLLSPSVQGNLRNDQTGGYTVVTTQKRSTTNFSGSNAAQGQHDSRNLLQNIAKTVQRSSNDVTQSAVKHF